MSVRTEVYLVRHGHAVWTLDEMRPLSAQGHRDAHAVADCLGGLGPQAIYSSPYSRARQTIEPLATRLSLPIHEVWDLRERQLSSGAVANFHEAVQATWGDFGFAHPGGETNREAQRRSAAVCRELVTREAGRRLVVSTHGSLLALLLNAFDAKVSFEFWTRISVPDVYVLAMGSRDDEFTIRRIWQPAVQASYRN